MLKITQHPSKLNQISLIHIYLHLLKMHANFVKIHQKYFLAKFNYFKMNLKIHDSFMKSLIEI